MKLTSLQCARIALSVIYVWFGALKVVGLSPANPLVVGLLERTMPFMSFDLLIIWFGIFEVIIGLLFLIPKFDRITLWLFAAHMVTTIMPLYLLPAFAWSNFFVPTLEGQYMIKNIALIALAVRIYEGRVR